ncbi:aminotransferase class III-fold pyridoxal phosphate-dependent enzyme [Catenovulum sp. 2E275]|uniref:aminotransferase class III-fold pyridoxal phosphate-dependent enzyme n=1 Tax=Catenovulum sp. 2E275 TaxID=2980497 RepID=UPI0021D2AA1A|nr:aminotransferase class III-fold pyridoxal phosphate-dependent enzyme [Catenovulum sp. 2E275]MCU4677552.1 aminotransferase class III-fold pyridoxal phosphate-dependent enzyme [Catenovulum sp. 2E275]
MDRQTVIDDKQYVFRSWTAQNNANPIHIEKGLGAFFWDTDGKRYLDLASQRVNLNLGHNHPKMIAAMKSQIETLTTCAQVFATDARAQAAKLIAQKTPGDLNKIFFTNSGSDAVEHAVRIAKIKTGRRKIMTMHKSYHGATAGALTLTGDPRRWYIDPSLEVVRFFGPYLNQSVFYSENEREECNRSLEHLKQILKHENPESIAAILIEPIVGSNGVLVPPNGYLENLKALCEHHGILLICDEVMTGFGRTGEWFAVDYWGVCPDMITFAKGVNSGYVPLGGVAISDRIASYFDDNYFPGGGTYYGHPLATATAVASITILEEEQLIQKAKMLGLEIIEPKLNKIKIQSNVVSEIRGRGLFWAIEIHEQDLSLAAHGNQSECLTKTIYKEALKAGLFLLVNANCVFICPPLVISEHDLVDAMERLEEIICSVTK